MRTKPIQIFDNKKDLNEFLIKIRAKEHYKIKKHYGTPDNKVYRIAKRKDDKFAIYEIYGAVRKDGYVVLDIANTSITKHRFIMECFNGKKPKGLEIDHGDSNKENCTLSNLKYMTHAENMKKYWRERRTSHATF